MKKIRILLIVSTLFFFSISSIQAQVGININIGTQPQWGPVSYDYVEYYYLPEYDVYYNAPQSQFIYLNGSNWVFASNLPSRYHNVDLYRTYKVVINEPKPYLKHSYYAGHYKKYKNVHSKQGNIRDSRDIKYVKVNNHSDNSKNVRIINQGGGKIHQSADKRGGNEQQKGHNGDKGNKKNKDH